MTDIMRILKKLDAGEIRLEEAERQLRLLALDAVGELAMLDVNRVLRNGVPEVVMAQTKSSDEILAIVKKMLDGQKFALVTRLTEEKLAVLKDSLMTASFLEFGRDPVVTALAHLDNWEPHKSGARIALITAGTSDIPYADEAKAIAHVMGVEVLSFYDVGVAGIHRLIEPLKNIIEQDVGAIVVFAGMEGALPTVVAALVDIPVIGVPVPVGYGFGGNGETALASMLQSCAPGLAVVNIGNGFGAGAMASLIAKRRLNSCGSD